MTTQPLAGEQPSPPDSGDAVVAGLRLLPLRLLQYFSLFFAGWIVARALGPEGRAAYALPTTLASSVFVVVNLTATEAAGRLLANRAAPIESIVRTLCALSLGLSVVGGVIFLMVARLLEGSVIANAASTVVLLSLATIPPAVVAQAAAGILLRTDRLATFVRINAIAAMVQAATVTALDIFVGLTPALATVGLVVYGVVVSAGLTLAVGKTLGARALRPAIDLSVLRPLLRVALQLHPGTLAMFLTLRVDLLVMAVLTSDRQVGLYSLAVTLGELALFAAVALSQAAVHHQTNEAEGVAARFTTRFVRQSWPIIAGCSVAISLAAWPVVRFVYGAEWEPLVPALLVLTWAVTALAVTGPLPVFLTRSIAPMKMAGAAGTALLANLILLVVLVPLLGATGAALASLGGYWLYAATLIHMMRRHHGIGVGAMLALPQPGDPVARILQRGRA